MVDFCEYYKKRKKLKFRLAAGSEVEEFSMLDGNNKNMLLKIYQKSGKTIGVGINLKWIKGKFPTFSVVS